MKTLDRTTVKSIADDVMTALEAVAAKHGIKFSYKGGRFSSTNVTYKIEAATIGDGGVVVTGERDAFTKHAELFGLKSEWLDKTFNQGGHVYTIVGLSTRKHKNPVMCKQASNGKTYIFPVDLIKLYMNLNKTAVTA